jgi:hypothetical protein
MSIIEALALPDTKERAMAEYEFKYDDSDGPEVNFFKACDIILQLETQLQDISKRYCDERMIECSNVSQLAIEQWVYNKKFLRQFFAKANISLNTIRERFGERADILIQILS